MKTIGAIGLYPESLSGLFWFMASSCPLCQTMFEPLAGGYAPDGRVVCAPCAGKLKKREQNAAAESAGSAFPGSIGSVLIGLSSFLIEHRFVFFLFPLMAIGFGLGTAWAAFSNPATREKLGWKRVPTMAFGVLGAAIGVLSLLAYMSSAGE